MIEIKLNKINKEPKRPLFSSFYSILYLHVIKYLNCKLLPKKVSLFLVKLEKNTPKVNFKTRMRLVINLLKDPFFYKKSSF